MTKKLRMKTASHYLDNKIFTINKQFFRTFTYPFFLISLILNYSSVDAEEAETNTENSNTQIESQPPSVPWPMAQERIEKDNNADTSFWIEIDDNQSLLLQYRKKNPKLRGNIIFLHAQGENATHSRITSPLAQQLSRLGWDVFIPNLPMEDFPSPTTQSNSETTNNSPIEQPDNQVTQSNAASNTSTNSPNTNDEEASKEELPVPQKVFFNSPDDYQVFINKVINAVLQKIPSPSNQLVLIGNQHSAYWMLKSTQTIKQISQVVLINPQIPSNITPDLKSNFEQQSTPVFAFIPNNIQSSPFLDAFNQRYWRTKFFRLNRDIIETKQLHIEDTRLAKAITGWINSQITSNNSP